MADWSDATDAIRGSRLALEHEHEHPGGATKSRVFHTAVAAELRARGWTVRTEVRVTYAGREGKLDIVAERDAAIVAIELDAAAPRVKSLAKLRAYTRATARVVGLRVGYAIKSRDPRRLPVGIDAIAAVHPPRVVERRPR